MKYGFIHIVIGALLIGSCLVGCRASKNSQRNETSSEVHARTESTLDSTKSEYREVESRNILTDASDEYYLRITEYDVEGAVRRISEKWGNRRLSNVDSQDRQQESVSVTGSESNIVETDSSNTVIEEKVDASIDSRPVQGVEWFWVILGGAIILAIVIFVIIKKNRK